MTVQLPPGRSEIQGPRFQGRVYAMDEALDLALIEIDDNASPTVSWGNWQELMIGDQVFAFGFSESQQVPDNLVAGVVKELPTGALAGERNATETSLGTSLVFTGISTISDFQGGPLLNLNGDVLGMNAAHLDSLREGPPWVLSPSLFAQDLIDGIPHLGSSIPILTTTPSFPIAGRPVSFTLETQPNRIARVTLLDPAGQAVPWIYPEGATRADDGQTITTRTLGADACGIVAWVRHGFRDIPGDWTAKITLSPYADQPETASLNYTLNDLELEDQGKIHFGTDLRRYQGPES